VAEPPVLLLLADRRDGERARLKQKPVVRNLERDQLGKDLSNALLARLPEAEQIQIPRRPVRRPRPEREERGALQHEGTSVLRAREPVEPALVRVAQKPGRGALDRATIRQAVREANPGARGAQARARGGLRGADGRRGGSGP
jgi:hypothetical protein